MNVDPQFLEPEYPFEWGGVYALDVGSYTIQMEFGPDPEMDAVLLPVGAATAEALAAAQLQAVLLFWDAAQRVASGSQLTPNTQLLQLDLS